MILSIPSKDYSADITTHSIDGVVVGSATQDDLCRNVKRLFPEAQCNTVETRVNTTTLKLGRIYQRKVAGKQKCTLIQSDLMRCRR